MHTIVDAAKRSGNFCGNCSRCGGDEYARQIGQEVHLHQLNISNAEALKFMRNL